MDVFFVSCIKTEMSDKSNPVFKCYSVPYKTQINSLPLPGYETIRRESQHGADRAWFVGYLRARELYDSIYGSRIIRSKSSYHRGT